MLSVFSYIQIFSLFGTVLQHITILQILGQNGINSLQTGIYGALGTILLLCSIYISGNIIDKVSSTLLFKKIQIYLGVCNLLAIPIYIYMNNLYTWMCFGLLCSFFSGFELSARQQFLYDNINWLNKNNNINAVSYDMILASLGRILSILVGLMLLNNLDISSQAKFTYIALIPFILNGSSSFIVYLFLWRNNDKLNIKIKEKISEKIWNQFEILKFLIINNKFKKLLILETIITILFYNINGQVYLLNKDLGSEIHFSWYLLFSGIANFLMHKQIGHYSYKRTKSISIILFILGLLISLCGVIFKNVYISICGHMILAATCSFFVAGSRQVLHKLTNKKENHKGKIFALFMMIFSINSAIGVFLFGFIAEYFSFKAYYILNLTLFISLVIFMSKSESKNKIKKY